MILLYLYNNRCILIGYNENKHNPSHSSSDDHEYCHILQNALIGSVVSISVSMWLALGSFFDRPPPHPLDALAVGDCLVNTSQTSSALLSSTTYPNITSEPPSTRYNI